MLEAKQQTWMEVDGDGRKIHFTFLKKKAHLKNLYHLKCMIEAAVDYESSHLL